MDYIYERTKDELDKYGNHILWAFQQSMVVMRSFFKNKDFSYENEYRLVLLLPDFLLRKRKNEKAAKKGRKEKKRSDIVETGQFLRGNVLVPYVDYRIRKDSVKCIKMNPYIKEDNTMFEQGIKHLLWRNGLGDVDVKRSNIPVRKYE